MIKSPHTTLTLDHADGLHYLGKKMDVDVLIFGNFQHPIIEEFEVLFYVGNIFGATEEAFIGRHLLARACNDVRGVRRDVPIQGELERYVWQGRVGSRIFVESRTLDCFVKSEAF